jgi:hypothetical protein
MRNLRRAATIAIEIVVLLVLIVLSPILVPVIWWFAIRDA